jgi:hypothetical protein
MKLAAAKRDTPISALLAATLSELADQEEGHAEVRDATLADLAQGCQLGMALSWNRDSLHDR